MARLKIPTPTSTTGDYDQNKPSVEGYARVVAHILKNKSNFTDFILEDDDERPETLQKIVRGSASDNDWPNLAVFHQVIKPSGVEYERIDGENCQIKIQRDKQKRKNRNKPSRYTISLPETKPDATLDYLHEYAVAVHDLYEAYDPVQDNRDHPDLVKARQFMFGIMLLTRCR
jgi:hypothetical protein